MSINSATTSLFAALLLAGACSADWREDSGFYALQAELGLAMPTGAGISVLQSEANAGGYLPQASAGTVPFAGTGVFAGKTITPHSGASGLSNHAHSVAHYFFSNAGSMSPGVTDVHCWLADDFAVSLASGTPPAYTGSVQNHSWVGSFGSTATDQAVLRRLDYMIQRDAVTIITPLNNGGTMMPLLANAYHSLTVGLRSGNHPTSGTNTDGAGRMKPDLVVNQDLTSYAGPSAGSAAVLLLDAIRPAYPVADNPRVVKALLLAGASKDRLPAWRRTTTANPYDSTWGAGELNVQNSHRILATGRAVLSPLTDAPLRGWDVRSTDSTQPVRYFFTIPEATWAGTFSAVITWHRSLAPPTFTPSLANLNLRLFAADAFVVQGHPIDESVSTVDNVEHLFLRNLPPGQYALEITSDTSNVEFGIAWEAQRGTGPAISVRRETGGQVYLDLSQLDPYVTYTIESSETLAPTSWDEAGAIRTADYTASTTATWQDTALPLPAARYYRLKWTSPRD